MIQSQQGVHDVFVADPYSNGNGNISLQRWQAKCKRWRHDMRRRRDLAQAHRRSRSKTLPKIGNYHQVPAIPLAGTYDPEASETLYCDQVFDPKRITSPADWAWVDEKTKKHGGNENNVKIYAEDDILQVLHACDYDIAAAEEVLAARSSPPLSSTGCKNGIDVSDEEWSAFDQKIDGKTFAYLSPSRQYQGVHDVVVTTRHGHDDNGNDTEDGDEEEECKNDDTPSFSSSSENSKAANWNCPMQQSVPNGPVQQNVLEDLAPLPQPIMMASNDNNAVATHATAVVGDSGQPTNLDGPSTSSDRSFMDTWTFTA